MTIRPPREADAAAVAAIYAHHVDTTVATFDTEAPDAAHWVARWADLADRGLPALVAEREGAVVGFAHVAPWNPKAAYARTVESTVYLAPGEGGRGLGTRLYGALLERAEEAGVHRVIALVAVGDDESSARLHARLGFAEVGRLTEVGHKFGRWIDVRILAR